MSTLPEGTVTLVFTDVEGSTRLLRSLGDTYRQALADHDRLLRLVLGSRSGYEVNAQGDGFFFAFGRAKDAVAAVVAAQQAFAEHEWPEGAEVRIRVGIHTGEPAVSAGQYIGLDVHRAARISSVGHGGQVLVSNATCQLIGGDLPRGVSLRALGEQRLKDFHEPEPLFQLVIDGLPDQFPPLKSRAPVPGAAFVGRHAELDELQSAVDDMFANRGSVVLLVGEPGVGKSRLAEEIATRAHQGGAQVVFGRCWEAGGAPAYWPWVQALRAYIREARPATLRLELADAAAVVAQIVPEVRDVLPETPESVAGDSEGARFRLFDSTTAFLRRAAMRRRLVVVLDDLHAADTPSLLLLQFLAGELGHFGLLVLGTYRPTEAEKDAQVRSVLAELSRSGNTRLIALGGLTVADTGLLIEDVAGAATDEAVAAAIHRETEGHPLFVSEVVRLLATEGMLDRPAQDVWRQIRLPESVKEVLRQRLAQLSEPCRGVLTGASVLGREFRLDALELVSELQGDELLDVLDEALSAGVLSEAPVSRARLRFAHALVRETLYDELTPLRRARLHRRIGAALERLYEEDLDGHAAELAHHFFEAVPGGDIDKAIAYARRAARRATSLTGYEEATRLHRMALELLSLREPADDATRCDVLLELADALARGGETGAARESFLEAARLARTLRRPDLLVSAALGYGGRFVWEAARGDPHLLPLLEEALDALEDQQQSALRARLLARLAGGPLRDELRRERRDLLSAEAVETARGLGDPATLAWTLDGRHAAVWWPENLEERLEIATELVHVAADAGDKERTLQGHHYRFIALLELGDLPGAHAEVEAQARLAEELRQPTQLFYVATCQATLAAFEGRFDEAAQRSEEAYRYGERAEREMAVIYRLIQRYFLGLGRAGVAALAGPIGEAIEAFPTYPVLSCLRAHLSIEIGEEEHARRTLEPIARDGFSRLPKTDEWVFGLCLLADVVARLKDERRADQLYELLAPYAQRNAVSAPDACIGSVSRSLGVLAGLLGEATAGIGHLEDALVMNSRAGAWPWIGRTQCDLAELLARRGAAGDHERALELLHEASTVAARLELGALAQRADRLAVALESTP